MKKKNIFFCDVIIKSKKNPNIIAILRLARVIDYSGFEIDLIMEEVKKDEKIMKALPISNDIPGLSALRWNLFCRIHILKKFQQYGFYERCEKHTWISPFEI